MILQNDVFLSCLHRGEHDRFFLQAVAPKTAQVSRAVLNY